MKRSWPRIAFFILALTMIPIGLAWMAYEQENCHQRGGVLVRNVWNFPECVAGAK